MKSSKKQSEIVWRLTLAASLLCGLFAVVSLLSTPSESSAALFLGYSAERLVLAGVVLLLVFAQGAVLLRWRALRRPREQFVAWLIEANPWIVSICLGGILMLATGAALMSPGYSITMLGPLALYAQRLQPVFAYMAVLAAGLLLLWLTARGLDLRALRSQRQLLVASLIAFASLVGAILIIVITRVGLGFDATRWMAPNAPILLTQVVLTLITSISLLIAIAWLRKRYGFFERVDLVLAVLVWMVAAGMWLQQPAQPTYYSSDLTSPNYESYPLSDAFNHDVIAQNVQIGEGFHFGGMVAIRRPLYVMFLSGVEALFNSDYTNVIAVQVMVLALFPAALYLLGTRLHHRLSGLLLAGFMIFRETNAIALGHIINLSHAKMLMADLPAALGIATVGVLAVGWLSKTKPDARRGLLVGGVLGAFVLLRSQMLTVVPAFVLLAVLVWGFRKGWRSGVLFGIGVLLVASPWVVRNRLGMGQWAIEDSIVSGFLANRYRYEPGTFGLPFLMGETEGEYYARQMGAVRSFMLKDPLYVAGFVTDNFVRNQIVNFMTLPTTAVLRSLEAHVRELPYWPSWDGGLASESYVIIALNTVLVSVGLAAAWQRLGWVGLVPLFINLGFTANLALARVAGWRYNLPADWTVLLYYAIGMGQLVLWVSAVLPKSEWRQQALSVDVTPKPKEKHYTPGAWISAVMALLLAGLSYSLIEALSSPRFSKLSTVQVLEVVEKIPSAPTELISLLESGQASVLHGRALYPSFYSAGQGRDNDFLLTQVQDYPRVSFFLIGPEPAALLLPHDGADLHFPNASDAIVIRCSSQDVNVLAVVLMEYGTIVPSARLSDGCQ
ncbi:MAG: hypothetical protein KIT08_06175 [Anaerolineales bacterium]|nr:MAG: hypothetical protein KIT08_06175 [Anaerolineales bacterium]